MTTLVLLPSPLTRAAVWGGLPDSLEAAGAQVAVLEPEGDDERPYALRWIASSALQIGSLPAGPVALVGHSGAGLLLARVGFALHASHRRVAAYAFVDAGVPRALPGSRLDDFRMEDPEAAGELEAHLASGGVFPTWTADDLADALTSAADRATVVASLRPRGLAYWTEALPPLVDWPDAPCVYLRTSEAYDGSLRAARARGWPTDSLDLGHFPGLVDADRTAHALLGLLAPVVPGLTTR